MNIHERIEDLLKQTTTENSHFYVADTLRLVRVHIRAAEARIKGLEAQVTAHKAAQSHFDADMQARDETIDALRVDVVRLERDKADLLDRITNTDAIQIVSLKQTVARLERENAELRGAQWKARHCPICGEPGAHIGSSEECPGMKGVSAQQESTP